jgi:hypothetical protein
LPLRPQSRLCHRAANSSVIAVGGLIVLLEVIPKKPTTTSPALAVVTDGATKDRLVGVNAPLCESTGADTSMRLVSRIAPAADTDEASVQV